MLKRENMPHLMGVAALALMFTAATVHPQPAPEKGASQPQGSAGALPGVGAPSVVTGVNPGGGPLGNSPVHTYPQQTDKSVQYPAKVSEGSKSAGDSMARSSGAAAGGSAAAGAGAGMKEGAKGEQLSRADREILQDMAEANMAEIEMGKMALEKSKDDQVQKFAQKMIDDHTKALNDVKKVAEAKGVKLPDQLDSKHKSMAKDLAKLSGDEFDKKYLAQGGVSDHKATHKELEKAASRAKDPQVKELAQKMQPTVASHLDMAQDMTGKQAGTKSSASGASGSSGASGAGKAEKAEKSDKADKADKSSGASATDRANATSASGSAAPSKQ